MIIWILTAVALLLGLLAIIQSILLRGGRAMLQAALRHCDSQERDLVALRRSAAQMKQDQEFVTHFLREFPHLTRELHGGMKERNIPAALLNIALRTLEPRHAMVLVRRGRTDGDPAASRLVVAAVAPGDSPIKVGTEIPMGQGELGFAAQAQRVMSRSDFDAEGAVTRQRLRLESPPGWSADIVAPMVLDQETLGVIALSGARRTGEQAKAALRVIAQTGAQVLHNAAAYTEMKMSADLDGLTRVFNKRHMTNTLAESLYKAQQELSPLSIFLFDIDHFKNYNDLNGHLAGDRLLRELAHLVSQNVRKDDIFGRFGGEEFLLVLPETRHDQALAVARKISALVSSHGFPAGERQPLGLLSVSGGVAEYPSDGLDSVTLLKAADEALYEAKRQGRNRVLAAPRTYLSDREPEIGEPAHAFSPSPAEGDAS